MSSGNKFLGIEIGGTKLQLAVVDADGSIEQNIRFTVAPGEGAANIQTQIAEGFAKLNACNTISAVGVGFGGPVNWLTGSIHISHQVKGWENFALAAWLKQLTEKPVFIDNDANVAALAEATFGYGKGHERVFYMTIGSGIGGGMIVHKEIYHGTTPGEVEIGHLKLNKKGVTLESSCSGWAVNERVSDYIIKNPDSLLAQMAKNKQAPEAALLKPAAEQNDVDAKKIIEEIADDISFALSHVVHLFHPDIVVIGGGLSLLNEHLRKPVEQSIGQYIMKAFLPAPAIMIAALGENVVPLGAAELAKKQFYKKTQYFI